MSKTVCPKDMRQLRRQVEALGFRVVQGGKHPKVLRPNGTMMMSLPSTPSDWRSVRNTWSDFNRLSGVADTRARVRSVAQPR